MDIKKIIQELNIVFKQRGWKLLPENIIDDDYYWDILILDITSLCIDRSYIPYEKYLNKFTIEQLDSYVVEFLKSICKKYNILF